MGEGMDKEKNLLIASAARLFSMGIDLETLRERVRQLVEHGVPHTSDEMKRAVSDFKDLEQQWKALEKQHLELRDEVMKRAALENRNREKT